MSNNQSSTTDTSSSKKQDDTASVRSNSTFSSTVEYLKNKTSSDKSGAAQSSKDSQAKADKKAVTDSASILRNQMNMNV